MNDNISRQAVLSLAKDVVLEGGIKHRCIDATMIHELPSAEPEREKGEWIRWYEEIKSDSCTEYIPHCKCSRCELEYDSHTTKFINFCPNCGALMSESLKWVEAGKALVQGFQDGLNSGADMRERRKNETDRWR